MANKIADFWLSAAILSPPKFEKFPRLLKKFWQKIPSLYPPWGRGPCTSLQYNVIEFKIHCLQPFIRQWFYRRLALKGYSNKERGVKWPNRWQTDKASYLIVVANSELLLKIWIRVYPTHSHWFESKPLMRSNCLLTAITSNEFNQLVDTTDALLSQIRSKYWRFWRE